MSLASYPPAPAASALLVLLLLQLGCHVEPAASVPTPTAAKPTAPTAETTSARQSAEAEPACGAEPKRLQGFKQAASACWAEAALAPAALSYQPFSAAGVQRVAATTWADLQRHVNQATGPVHVTLSGSLAADTPLLISGKPGMVLVSGPASITCSGSGKLNAFIIQRCGSWQRPCAAAPPVTCVRSLVWCE